MTSRQDVVHAAHAWLRTPYHPMADKIGVGVDCAMILVRVFCDLGLAEPVDPRPYPPNWFLHRDEERYLGWLTDRARKVDAPGLGDVALYRFGRCVSHSGIIVSEEHIIHAYAPERMVTMTEQRALAHRLVGYWSVFP